MPATHKIESGSRDPYAASVLVDEGKVVDSIMESTFILHLVQRRVREVMAYGAGVTDEETLKQFDEAINSAIDFEIENQSANQDDYLEGA